MDVQYPASNIVDFISQLHEVAFFLKHFLHTKPPFSEGELVFAEGITLFFIGEIIKYRIVCIGKSEPFSWVKQVAISFFHWRKAGFHWESGIPIVNSSLETV